MTKEREEELIKKMNLDKIIEEIQDKFEKK